MSLFAVLATAAIAVQFHRTLVDGGSAWNFLSFFTIASNLFAIAVLFAAPANGMLRGAATLYLSITGVVYVTLLARGDRSLLPWVNAIVHYLMPAAMAVSWLVAPPLVKAPYPRIIAGWLAYPLAYVVYSIVRGAWTGWYPYPFLDLAAKGPAAVAAAVAAIAIVAAALAAAIAWYAKRKGAVRALS